MLKSEKTQEKSRSNSFHLRSSRKQKMAGVSVSQRNNKTSVKCRTNHRFQGKFIELASFDRTDIITPSGNDKGAIKNSDVLSTADLISAVGHAWNRARKPLSALVSKSDPTCKTEFIQRDGILNYSTDEEIVCASNSSSRANYPRLMRENLEYLEMNRKIYCYDFFSLSTVNEDLHCLSSTEIPHRLGSMYSWMEDIKQTKNQYGPVKEIESKALKMASTVTYTENTEIIASRGCGITDMVSRDTNIAPAGHEFENSTNEGRDFPYGNQKDRTFSGADSSEVEFRLAEKEISPCGLAKQEHAFAGAMAGVFVSLCLHPMDTVKTVVQSRRADRKPIHDVGRSIIAERGITGLYRGIASNIVTSAPISAVYTFTYESVKKSLLPLLSKEYHSLAHCTAGGCASVATSFIFTPSERIKQQMQIGSHYRNCWNAFAQVVQKGGLVSLYAGWGAVLCRNVPHSVIKFYTYESLKQIMLSSTKSNAQANIVGTLFCGGLAGSMATLFTTPFDVVKTRLQTQIPGSLTTYSGVFNTLADIGKQEGLKGLYRGLTPRLVMYMIQGSIFFASYESFKTLFIGQAEEAR